MRNIYLNIRTRVYRL